MRNIVNILGVPIDRITMNEAVEKLISSSVNEKTSVVYTPNSEILAMADKDSELKTALKEADMLVPDGVGVIMASHFLGFPLPERVTGFDLMQNLLERADKMHLKVFLFGAAPGIAEQAKINIKNSYPGLDVVGVENGYGYLENEDEIIEKINSCEPDILFVALGAPRQEKWIYNNKNRLKAKICIGVGGSFDIIAGKKKRAPKIMQKTGLEWLYRLAQEPWRYRRMLEIPRFISLVIKNRRN